MYRIIFTEEAQKDLQMLLRAAFTNFNPLACLEGKLRLGRTKQNAPHLFLLC